MGGKKKIKGSFTIGRVLLCVQCPLLAGTDKFFIVFPDVGKEHLKPS